MLVQMGWVRSPHGFFGTRGTDDEGADEAYSRLGGRLFEGAPGNGSGEEEDHIESLQV